MRRLFRPAGADACFGVMISHQAVTLVHLNSDEMRVAPDSSIREDVALTLREDTAVLGKTCSRECYTVERTGMSMA